MKKISLVVLIIVLLAVLAGCGGNNNDVVVYIMPKDDISEESLAKIEADLKAYAGDFYQVSVAGSETYVYQRLDTELMTGSYDMFIMSHDDYIRQAKKGYSLVLEEHYDPQQYPGGVVERFDVVDMVDGKTITESLGSKLYGVPLKDSAWFKQSKTTEADDWYIMIMRGGNEEKSLDLLSQIMGTSTSK
jgi:ABC-type glycerol-3-phosphate transport system substrate-binding protein